MAHTREFRFLPWLACLLLAGCSIALDVDKKQCKSEKDCKAPYICGSQGLCKVQTGCTSDAECRAPGICVSGSCTPRECTLTKDCDDNQLCSTTSGRCVPAAKASCQQAEDCAGYDGAQVCIKSQGLCSSAECTVNEECTGTSPTAQCVEGACEDPTWGCLGLPDPRPQMRTSKQATLKVKVLYAFAQNGAKETAVNNLRIKACNFPDQNCANPIPAQNITYDDEHYVVITGLEAGLNYRIQLEADHPTKAGVPLIPGEYLMYRTAEGETVDPKPILMFEESVREMLASLADVKVDTSLGMLLTRIFDCSDTEVAGVVIGIDKQTTGCGSENCPTTLFYQNTTNLPDPGATETNSAGRAGIVNLKTGVYNRITLTRSADNKKITSFVITPRGGWITYVHFWPWDYGTAAD